MDIKDYNPDTFIQNFVFSKSSVNTLMNCALSFQYQYIEKHKSKPNRYMQKGTEIHNTIKSLNAGELCYENISKHKDHLKNYVDFLQKYKLDVPIINDDKELKLNISGLNFTSHVDAVYKKNIENEDRFMLVDYKTGTPKYTIADYDFELKLYSYITNAVLGYNVMSYGILFTKNGYYIWEYNDRNYDSMLETIEKVKVKLKTEVDKPTKSDLCPNCNFFSFCSAQAVPKSRFQIQDSFKVGI